MTITNTDSSPLAFYDTGDGVWLLAQTSFFEEQPLERLPNYGSTTGLTLHVDQRPAALIAKRNEWDDVDLLRTPEASIYTVGRVHRWVEALRKGATHNFAQIQDQLEALKQGCIYGYPNNELREKYERKHGLGNE